MYRANLEALDKDTIKLLTESPEKPIAIEEDVRVQGLKNPNFLFIIGFATKRVLEAARSSGKDITNVVIIEPDPGVFHQTLRREYVADLIRSENIDFLIGVPPNELGPHLYKLMTKQDKKSGPRASRCQQPEIVTDPFVYMPSDEIAAAITQQIVETSKQVFLSMGCAADSFSRWEQTIRNLPNIQNSYRIEPLFGKFEDVPVIVVGAGPSMGDFIDAYRTHDLGNRALIVACDASLKRLLAEGIKPHIVTRCERKFTTIFDGIDRGHTSGIYYAAYPWTPPEYFDLFDSSFMLFRDNGICRWTGYKPGSVNGGVSSANAALELAFLLGAKNIVLTGVDLCFMEGRSHVEGTEVEFDIEKSKPKWTEIPGNAGGTVTTIPVWNRCLNEYEQGIFRRPGQQVYNTSLKGARIEGTKVQAWKELADLFAGDVKPLEVVRRHLDKHTANYETTVNEKKKKSLEYLKAFRKDLKKLFLFMDDTMVTCRREEEKIVNQLKSSDPKEYFAQVHALRTNLAEVYKEPCRQVDQFKFKHFTKMEFSELVLDICQLDLFQMENKMHGLKNTQPIEHERLKAYIGLHMSLYRLFETYTDRLIDLLEKGPEAIVYNPEDCLEVG